MQQTIAKERKIHGHTDSRGRKATQLQTHKSEQVTLFAHHAVIIPLARRVKTSASSGWV